MLPKKYRLTYQEFVNNPQTTEKFNTQTFVLVIKKSNKISPKFVILAPKSLDKRSTLRHKTKRIIVEIIRQKLIGKVKNGVDILIKLRKIIKKQDQITINELVSVFRKAKLL